MARERVMRKEADVKTYVRRILDKHKWFWWCPPANGFGRPNVDFNALKSGVFLAIETKFGSNKPTLLQCAYLSSVLAEGGFAFVVNDKNLEIFEAWMQLYAEACDDVLKGMLPDQIDGAAMLDCIRELTRLIIPKEK